MRRLLLAPAYLSGFWLGFIIGLIDDAVGLFIRRRRA